MSRTAADVVSILRGMLPEGRFYPLHEPVSPGQEKAYVSDCIDTGRVSSVGSYVSGFEEKLAAFLGVKHVIAAVNGTAALHICLQLAGASQNDEVLCPSLTFIASANAVHYCGAIPHFVDVSPDTLGVCPARLETYLESIAVTGPDGKTHNKNTGRNRAALVVMHFFGHPVDIDGCARVCARFGIPLVEDAAESVGSYYHGRHTGGFGLLSAFSFNGNKIITTGGGGAIATNDSALAARAKHITTTAKKPHPYLFVHDEVGYNYRMPNINAALGVAQLEQLPVFLAAKRDLATRYREAFAVLDNRVRFISEPAGCHSNYWLNALLVPDRAERDALLEASNAQGIMTRPVWEPMHTLDMYADCPRDALDTTAELAARIVNIPSSANL